MSMKEPPPDLFGFAAGIELQSGGRSTQWRSASTPPAGGCRSASPASLHCRYAPQEPEFSRADCHREI